MGTRGGEGVSVGNKDFAAVQCCNPVSDTCSTFLNRSFVLSDLIVLICKMKKSNNYHAG